MDTMTLLRRIEALEKRPDLDVLMGQLGRATREVVERETEALRHLYADHEARLAELEEREAEPPAEPVPEAPPPTVAELFAGIGIEAPDE
jgi:hypothetical protein